MNNLLHAFLSFISPTINGPSRMQNFSSQVNQKLDEAKTIVTVASQFADTHSASTAKTVAALSNAITAAQQKDNQVQQYASEVAALLSMFGQKK